MKTTILFLAIALSMGTAMADDSRYTESMTKNIQLVYKAGSNEELLQAVNAFDRIGGAEKTKWEPFYYAAFGYVMMANREIDPDKKDAYLDQAKVAIDKAAAVKQNDSEIVALDGFVHMIRVTVDPASRGQKYSGMAMQSFDQAITLNPENPRALALMAQMQFGTARFFKSSTAEACATTTKAIEKFTTYKSENALAPSWGKGMAEGLLKQCEK